MSSTCWLMSSLSRAFPRIVPGANPAPQLLAARGERLSVQACARYDGDDHAPVAIRVSAPDGIAVRVRRVGHVPMPHFNTATPIEELDGIGHIPGLVPDPLFDDLGMVLGPHETGAFWLTVAIDPECASGDREIGVEVVVGEARYSLAFTVSVADLVLRPRRNFPATHWFYADALCDWYKVEPFDRRFWAILEPYLVDCAEHGLDTLLCPLFTPPTDGVKRPTQLVRVTREGEGYGFDFADVKRWVGLARASGIANIEWTHFFSQWGVRNALRVYEGQGRDEKLLWAPETGATSETYRSFLAQFLPAFRRFLDAEGLLARSFFHVSDEPHGPEHLRNYQAARALLKELAPWMRTMDALSEIEYGRDRVTDMPIPSIGVTKQYWREDIESWTYFCCGPRGRFVNRLLDTPLQKTRMLGWLFYRFRRLGFLHWGHNYWYRSQTRKLIDPYTVTDGEAWPGWAYGDTHVVYPGPDGPVDSIRWEVFAESLQDFALLQTADVDPDGELLSPLVDFDDFPRSDGWIDRARRSVLMG